MLRRVILPAIGPSLAAGAALTWARALGEFGATITFAGNFEGVTRTMPLAIYLLRNYMAGLPREVMESARVDGATDFDIFMKIVLPLSLPALASFAIFQFLWVWNDLLVALVFLGAQNDQLVLTGRLVNLLGSRGGNWEILTASAFITIVVPLIVFLSLQRFLVRGLLAGSVKG